MANHMAEVAKLLDLELREEFRIEKCQGLFRFTEDGLQRLLDSSSSWTFAEHSISDFRADFKKKHYHDCPEVNALYYALPIELYKKHKEEVEKSCEKVGAGIILIAEKELPNGRSYCYLETCAFAKKPKLRKAKPLTVYQKLKFARLGCLRWPSLWRYRNR